MNLIINNTFGDEYILSPFHKLYLDSLEKIKNCKKLLIVQNMSNKSIDKLQKYYDHIEIAKDTEFNYKQEHNLDYTTIKTVEKYFSHLDQAMYVDSFDVIIQSDPFEYISQFDKDIYLSSPGFKVKDQWPDRNWHTYFNKTLRIKENFLEQKVLNGAFYAGKIETVLDFLIFVITNQNRNGKHVVDQTVFNYYYYLMQDRNKLHVFDTREDNFMYHCQNEYFFGREDKANIIDGKIYTDKNELYCIWHQWQDLKLSAELDKNGMAYLR